MPKLIRVAYRSIIIFHGITIHGCGFKKLNSKGSFRIQLYIHDKYPYRAYTTNVYYNNYNYVNVRKNQLDLYKFEVVKTNTSSQNININKTSLSYTQARKKLTDSESLSSSILTSHTYITSKKYYIKNIFSQRFSPKLVPHDNITSKINFKNKIQNLNY